MDIETVGRPFRGELDEQNARLLKLSMLVFNPVYLLWTVFDYLVVPAHWKTFFVIRLVEVGINTLLYLPLRAGLKRHRQVGTRYLWVWFAVWGGLSAPMLPLSGHSLLPYVVAMCTLLFAAGGIPTWSPAWSISCLLWICATALAACLIMPMSAPTTHVVTALIAVWTVVVIGAMTGLLKYQFARKEFEARKALEREQRTTEELRESEHERAAELARALEQLRELDRAKTQFFANISHELRTPLTLILAPVQGLLTRPELAGERATLATVERNAQRLLRLIDDLLELSRLDAGGLRLNIAEVDLHSLAHVVFESGGPAAQTAGIDLRFEVAAGIARVHGDAHRLEIVLTNLVGNALKYTPRGGQVVIRGGEQGDHIELEVEDNGPGISAEDVPRVFDRFFQAGQRDRRSAGGVGIGLALAKELVERHGGTLRVRSELGKGSAFAVRLPLGREHLNPDHVERRKLQEGAVAHTRRLGDRGLELELEAPPAPPAPVTPADGSRSRPRVLLAEDNDELRRFIHDLLARDHVVLVARDGEEAFELALRERPDLVVSDVMMPRRSGTELCRAIKADPGLRSTPVILLTARVGSEATLEGYAHGADDFVAKPFHPQVLLARVNAQLRLRELALQLAQREKMAAIGTLAAGVLHEVRNPLNALLNATRVLTADGAPPSPTMQRKLLGVIGEASERIHVIATALDEHARPADGHDGGEGVPGDAQAGLEATLSLLEHRMQGVEIHRDYRAPGRMRIPGTKLNQILLNLLDNALKSGARSIWLETVSERGTVQVRLRDDGQGVPPGLADRLFDPFVRGDDRKEGSGLGLYLARRMAEEHQGRIRYEPRADGASGACFVVEAPAET